MKNSWICLGLLTDSVPERSRGRLSKNQKDTSATDLLLRAPFPSANLSAERRECERHRQFSLPNFVSSLPIASIWLLARMCVVDFVRHSARAITCEIGRSGVSPKTISNSIHQSSVLNVRLVTFWKKVSSDFLQKMIRLLSHKYRMQLFACSVEPSFEALLNIAEHFASNVVQDADTFSRSTLAFSVFICTSIRSEITVGSPFGLRMLCGVNPRAIPLPILGFRRN